MKIGLVRITFEFYPRIGGSITHAIELSKKIDGCLGGHTIIAPAYGGDYSEFDRRFGIPVVRVKYRGLARLASAGFPVMPLVLLSYARNAAGLLAERVREHKIDLVYVHGDVLGAYVAFLARLRKIDVPIVILRDGGIMNRWRLRPFLMTRLALGLVCLARPAHVFIVDDGTRIDRYGSTLGRWGIPYSIVFHAIDAEFYKTDQPRPGEFVVLSTSGVTAFKRVDLAIRAFARFLDGVGREAAVKLYVVGKGPLVDELTRMCTELGIRSRVSFTGGKTPGEVLDYLSIADVVVATSIESNMNLSTQEAMACGKPVVAFDCGGIRSLITDMEDGVLVKTGDVEAFAESLRLLYEKKNLRDYIGRRARERIISSRNWNDRLRRELEVYRAIVHGRQ